ncbi:hypothetical protein EV702DRAFT_1198056 [Suillus placidus]|uniref:Uncharacterized protein n=1 Tax=Suillus placidus TaxID=48579 RepID=A0A9P7D247_9AGAM|nr:hypothetical protein EV702DRAFT_1198056 [Suillus placidus]
MAFQCPSCGKGGFKDHIVVARHMSQPRSGCSTWLQDLICSRSKSDMDDEPMDNGPHIPDIESGGFGDWDETIGGSGSEGQAYKERTPTRDSEVDNSYPDCAQSYGRGHTFLDLFNLDENSEHRATNPYDPFSGRKDWEVGSWLLHSG